MACGYFQTVIALFLQPGKQKMNPERLSGYDSQWECSLELFPFRATATQLQVVHCLCHVINITPNYFTKLTVSRCLINGALF